MLELKFWKRDACLKPIESLPFVVSSKPRKPSSWKSSASFPCVIAVVVEKWGCVCSVVRWQIPGTRSLSWFVLSYLSIFLYHDSGLSTWGFLSHELVNVHQFNWVTYLIRRNRAEEPVHPCWILALPLETNWGFRDLNSTMLDSGLTIRRLMKFWSLSCWLSKYPAFWWIRICVYIIIIIMLSLWDKVAFSSPFQFRNSVCISGHSPCRYPSLVIYQPPRLFR